MENYESAMNQPHPLIHEAHNDLSNRQFSNSVLAIVVLVFLGVHAAKLPWTA
jgi:hypothetical protein